jgi:hypothetical protein
MKPIDFEEVTVMRQQDLICIYSKCKKSTVQEMCPKTGEPMLACRRGHYHDHVKEMKESCEVAEAEAKVVPVPEAKAVHHLDV